MDSSGYFPGLEDEQEVVDEAWYEKNLQLAAELGKALLERNRELEAQVTMVTTTCQEQGMEIQYLKTQLDTMRTMTESRNRVYEEVDKTAQELEKDNQKLTMEARGDSQKIHKQAVLIDQLEEKIDDLQTKIEEMKVVEKKEKKKAPEKRRTSSLNRLSMSDSKNQGFYFDNLKWTHNDQYKNMPLNPYENEIRKLQDSIGTLKVQKTIDRRKMEDLDVECSVLIDEKDSLENKVKVLETKLSEAIIIQYQLERQRVRSTPERFIISADGTRKSVGIGGDLLDMHDEMHQEETNLLGEIEHDDPELRSEAKAVKLESGGSLYSSTESINKVATDAREIQPEDASLSILDELESQYQSLFTKYNTLIQTKSSKRGEEASSSQSLANKEVQTLLHITLQRDYYQDSNPIPPYKALFKDIFATLRKNKIEETDAEAEKRLSGVYCQTDDGPSSFGIDGR